MKIIQYLMLFYIITYGQSIEGAGATFPYPIYSVWGYDYYKTSGIKLNYSGVGSGGGVREIWNRRVDFGASDAPLTASELEEKKLLQFPATIGAVVPVINIPEIKKNSLKLSGEVIGKIFSGEITHWNAADIIKLNPDVVLPSAKITLVYRADKSGTTAIFTKYLAEAYSAFSRLVGVGKHVQWPEGIRAKGNSGVANYVKRTKYSIGYVNYNYALQNRLSSIYLENQEGEYVLPTIKSFASAAEYADWNPKTHFYAWLVNAPGKNSWPIAGASFILIAKEQHEQNTTVSRFFLHCFEYGASIAKKRAYIPIPKTLVKKIKTYWAQHGIEGVIL